MDQWGEADHLLAINAPTGDGRGTSFARTLYNVLCTMAGAGVLQLAFTLRLGGWTSLLVLLAVAVMANYTGKILIKALYTKQMARLTGYPHLGHSTFGYAGQAFVHVFHKATLFGIGTVFLILSAKFFAEIFDGVLPGPDDDDHYTSLWTGRWILILAVVELVPVVGLKTMSEIAILSLFGIFATVLVVLVVSAVSLYEYKPGQHAHLLLHLRQFPNAYSSITLGFGGHSVFPTLEEHMQNPSEWPRVLNWAFSILMLLYVPTAAFGYLAYGETVVSPILDSLTHSGVLGTFTLVAKAIIAVHVLCAYPISINCFVVELEKALDVHEDDTHGAPISLWSRVGIRMFSVGLTAVIAYFVPFFATMMNLIGALCITMMVFVLPVVFHLRINWYSTSLLEKAWCALIVCCGLVGGSIGTYDSVSQVADAIKHGGHWG